MAKSADFNPAVCYDLSTTIPNGTSVSGVIDLIGTKLLGLFIPASFEGTSLTFQAANSAGGSYVTLQSGGSTYTIVGVLPSRYVALDPNVFAGARFLTITISAGGPVGAARVIGLATRPA